MNKKNNAWITAALLILTGMMSLPPAAAELECPDLSVMQPNFFNAPSCEDGVDRKMKPDAEDLAEAVCNYIRGAIDPVTADGFRETCLTTDVPTVAELLALVCGVGSRFVSADSANANYQTYCIDVDIDPDDPCPDYLSRKCDDIWVLINEIADDPASVIQNILDTIETPLDPWVAASARPVDIDCSGQIVLNVEASATGVNVAGGVGLLWASFTWFKAEAGAKSFIEFNCSSFIETTAVGGGGFARDLLVTADGAPVATEPYSGLPGQTSAEAIKREHVSAGHGSGIVDEGDEYPDHVDVCTDTSWVAENRPAYVGVPVTDSLADPCVTLTVKYVTKDFNDITDNDLLERIKDAAGI